MVALVTYSYEKIEDERGVSWRVRDDQDNRVATCWVEENAFAVTEALNYRAGLAVAWSCGHTAKGHCAQCYTDLAAKAHEMAEALHGYSTWP